MGRGPFKIADCPHGQGVFANREFKKGEVLYRFEGRRIHESQVEDSEFEGHYLQVGPYEYVDTVPPGRFTCHSCEPNCGLIDDITLATIRDIAKGEEIVFDYSTSMMEKHWTLACGCGAKKCRGIIEDFDQLPEKLQEYYIQLGIVPHWILAAIAPMKKVP